MSHFHYCVPAYHCGFLSMSLEDIREREVCFASFHCSHEPSLKATIRKLYSQDMGLFGSE